MSMPAAIAAGLGTSMAAEAIMSEPGPQDFLREIRDLLKASNAYNVRERERTPAIYEIGVVFTAGVRSQVVDFIPPSSFNTDYIVLTTSAAIEIELRMGTRGPRIMLGTSTPPLPLPYHFNGGTQVSIFDPSGAANATVRGFIVGWLEQNRIGPRNVGDDD